jgi:hypothetical protein
VNLTLKAATLQPGQKPVVDFNIKDNSGATIDPSSMNLLEVTIAYPTTDYATRVTDTVNQIVSANSTTPFVRRGTLTPLPGGDYRYVFANPMPHQLTARRGGDGRI